MFLCADMHLLLQQPDHLVPVNIKTNVFTHCNQTIAAYERMRNSDAYRILSAFDITIERRTELIKNVLGDMVDQPGGSPRFSRYPVEDNVDEAPQPLQERSDAIEIDQYPSNSATLGAFDDEETYAADPDGDAPLYEDDLQASQMIAIVDTKNKNLQRFHENRKLSSYSNSPHFSANPGYTRERDTTVFSGACHGRFRWVWYSGLSCSQSGLRRRLCPEMSPGNKIRCSPSKERACDQLAVSIMFTGWSLDTRLLQLTT